MKQKNKTHKATAKRFKISAKGKLLHKKQGNNNHYMTKMGTAQRLRVEGEAQLSSKKQTKTLKQIGNLK